MPRAVVIPSPRRRRPTRIGRRIGAARSTVSERRLPLGAALDLLRCVWQLNHALERVSSRMVKEFGVTAQQRLVIRCVGKFPTMTVGALARVLHLDPGTVSTALNRLEDHKVLSRQRDAHDGRRVLLRLTAKGRGLDRPSAGTVEHAVERLFRAVSADEIAAFKTVMSRLVELLHAEAE